jgi:hypothetical protein
VSEALDMHILQKVVLVYISSLTIRTSDVWCVASFAIVIYGNEIKISFKILKFDVT